MARSVEAWMWDCGGSRTQRGLRALLWCCLIGHLTCALQEQCREGLKMLRDDTSVRYGPEMLFGCMKQGEIPEGSIQLHVLFPSFSSFQLNCKAKGVC